MLERAFLPLVPRSQEQFNPIEAYSSNFVHLSHRRVPHLELSLSAPQSQLVSTCLPPSTSRPLLRTSSPTGKLRIPSHSFSAAAAAAGRNKEAESPPCGEARKEVNDCWEAERVYCRRRSRARGGQPSIAASGDRRSDEGRGGRPDDAPFIPRPLFPSSSFALREDLLFFWEKVLDSL